MTTPQSLALGITHAEVTDFQGLSVCISPRLNQDQALCTINAINAFMHQVFKYGRNWRVILDALRTDITCLLANIFATDYFIAKEDIQSALLCLKRAKANKKLYASRLSERENLYLAAYEAWLSGKPNVALLHFTTILKLKPQDLFAAKRAQLMAFILGDATTMLSILTQPAVEKACSKRPYYHGMLSFALEQNNLLAEAYAAARIGVGLCPDDPWAHHAVAHALYFQGKLRTGLNFLLAASPHWNQCMSFMLTHNWFHVALMYIDLNDFARTAIVFDHGIWRHPDLERLEPHFSVETVLGKLHFKLILPSSSTDRNPDVIALSDALNVAKMHEHYLAGTPTLKDKSLEPTSQSTDEDLSTTKIAESQSTTTIGENSLLPPTILAPQPLMKRQDKDYSQDFLGAAGLLWKLEMRINGTCGVRADAKFVRRLLRDTLNFEDRLVGGAVAQTSHSVSAKSHAASNARKLGTVAAAAPALASGSAASPSTASSRKMPPSSITVVAASTLFGAASEQGENASADERAAKIQLTAMLPAPNQSVKSSHPSVLSGTGPSSKHGTSPLALLHPLRLPAFDARWHDIALHAKVPSTHADPFCDIMTAHALGRAGLIEPLAEHVISARKATLSVPVRKRRAQLMLSLVPMLEAILAFHTHDFVLARAWLAPVFGLYPSGNAVPSPFDVMAHRTEKPGSTNQNASSGLTVPRNGATNATLEDALVTEVMGGIDPVIKDAEKSEATWDLYMSVAGQAQSTRASGDQTSESRRMHDHTPKTSSVDTQRYFSHDTFARYAAEAGTALPERIQAVGGSSEQREVFSEFYIEILFAVGDLEEILRVLDRKIRNRPVPHLHLLRSQAYSLLQKQALFALNLVAQGYNIPNPKQLQTAAVLDETGQLDSVHLATGVGLVTSMAANEVTQPAVGGAEGGDKFTSSYVSAQAQSML